MVRFLRVNLKHASAMFALHDSQWENDQLSDQIAALREEQAATSELLSSSAFLEDACAAAGAPPGHGRVTELRTAIAAALEQAARDTRRRREDTAAAPSAMAAVGTAVRWRNSLAGAVRGGQGGTRTDAVPRQVAPATTTPADGDEAAVHALLAQSSEAAFAVHPQAACPQPLPPVPALRKGLL